MNQRLDFEAWLKQVDAILLQRCGMSNMDLPDGPAGSYYEQRKTPAQYARKLISIAKGERQDD